MEAGDRDTYKLWQIFTDPGTGKKAVALSITQANVFISVYTNLLNIIMAISWCILISFPLLFLSPRKMNRTMHIAAITAWNCSDPWSASVVLGRHCFQVLKGTLAKTNLAELTWKAFWFDIALLSVALITALGGWALGTLFPIALTLGNIAPVNPRSVYLPLSSYYADSIEQKRVEVEYSSIGALKAFGSVDNSGARTDDQEQLVNLEWEPLDSWNGEDRYSIQYSYKVTGVDMGLQKLRDFSLEVSGNCSFQDTWWYAGQYTKSKDDGNGTAVLFEIYINWEPATLLQYPDVEQTPFNYDTSTSGNNSAAVFVPSSPGSPPTAKFYLPTYTKAALNQETGRSYYVIIPATARRPIAGTSTDPWYATEVANFTMLNSVFPNVVKSGRPPILCQEYNQWSSGGWKGTMKNLVSDGPDGPPVPLPAAIVSLFQYGLGATPMIATLGRAISALSLRSVTRLIEGELELAIDPNNARARDDIERLVQAAYLATRDIFRNSALAGSILKDDLSSGALKNAMLDLDTGKPISGTEDFVITSSAVQALNLTAMISVVCVLVCLIVILLLLRAVRKLKPTNKTASPGRLDRYLLLVSALNASQLYRMVDQLLADRAPSDKEGLDGESHKIQAQWRNQISDFPFVSPNKGASPTDEIIQPQFQLQAKGKDRRLILDIKRVDENEGRWRSLQVDDGKVRLAEAERQLEEEQEMFNKVNTSEAPHEDSTVGLKSDGADNYRSTG